MALQSYAFLPHRDTSLRSIERLQQVLGRKLPVVLQPPAKAADSGVGHSFGEKLIQPSQELMRLWGAIRPGQLTEEARYRGYTGFCLDTFHLRERGFLSLSDWRQTILQLLPFTKMVAVSAGRVDMGTEHNIPTMNELGDLINNTSSTDLPAILGFIRDQGWSGPVVTKIPAAAITLLTCRKFNLVDDHSRIVETIGNLMS